MKLLLLNALTLAAEAPAGEEEKFDPSHEFELPAFVPIHIGPLDMSINKAVIYLWLGSLLTMAIGILLMRFRLRVTPDRRQTIGEQIYDVAQTLCSVRPGLRDYELSGPITRAGRTEGQTG